MNLQYLSTLFDFKKNLMTASLFINIQGKKTSKINCCHLFLQRALLNNDKNFEQFEGEAESFMCRILPNSPYKTTQYTQGKTTSLSLLYIYNILLFPTFKILFNTTISLWRRWTDVQATWKQPPICDIHNILAHHLC